jgi:Domain of unknown function (DUF4145)
VKETNLNIWYHLGRGIKNIDKLEPETELSQALFLLFDAYAWLINFVYETEGIDIPDTRAAAQSLMEAMDLLGDIRTMSSQRKDTPVTREEVWKISGRRDWFEKCLDREYRSVDVFTVTPEGIYDTRLLMLRPEDKFPGRVRVMLPPQALSDLKQAAKCLAFEIPTACAFHICRATEALMLAYYEALSGHPWHLPKNRDWKTYIDHLAKEGAPKAITSRLDEIREMDRNAYAHPDRNVTLEESPVQFELCTNVIFQMGSEMDKKLNP